MEYSRLDSILKRFSFEEKMRMAQISSRRTFTPKGVVEVDELREIPAPWELETFVLFAIKAVEWDNKDFKGKNTRKFSQIINCIRNEIPPLMEEADGENFLTWFLAVTASVQFEIQEHYPFKMFRFHYFFTFVNDKINMPKLFKDAFVCDYLEYCILGELLWLGFSTNSFSQKMFDSIIAHFAIPVSQLIITRTDYIDALDKIATDPVNYLYCLRPSYSYPFLANEGKVYCPLPHLLSRATTSALMHRLTDGNSGLMAQIGKEVYENYLYTIINESSIFEEVIPEKAYLYQKAERRTADVMTRVGDNYIFFDSKSFTPKIAIRTFSQEALDQDVRRLAESFAQVYKHIRHRFPSEYCYFENKPESPVLDIYGLVVVQENPYIRGYAIYEKAADILGLTINSEEYIWLYTHVGMVSIYDIERYCFTGTDMLQTIKHISDEKKITVPWLTADTNKKISYKRYKDFNAQLRNDMVKEIDELGK